MKKILSLILSIGLISSSSTSVISCKGITYAGIDGQKVLVLSDSGPKNDKSFNESSYNGMLEWANANKIDESQDYTRNFVQPKTAIPADVSQALKQTRRFKPNALILSGGTFGDDIDAAEQAVGSDSKLLWVDGTSDQTKEYNNIICIQFQAEIAGFEAGYAAVSEFVKKVPFKKNITLGTYGGGIGNLPYGVTYYMWGFILGAMYYGNSNGSKMNLSSIQVNCGKTNDSSYVKWKDNNISSTGKLDGFTGNFEQASTESSTYASYYKSNDINFVVAGPQVADLLANINDDSNKYVVGVDVDQASSYINYKSHFLFSAGKDIKTSISTALSGLDTLTQKNGEKGNLDSLPWSMNDKTSKTITDKKWSTLLTSENNIVKNENDLKEYTNLGSTYGDIIDQSYDDAVNNHSDNGIDIDLSTIITTIEKLK